MADTSNLSNFLEDVADAIRTKKETTEKIPAANFDTEILSITTGTDTSDATATPDDILYPKTAYVNGKKIIGNIEATYKVLSDVTGNTGNDSIECMKYVGNKYVLKIGTSDFKVYEIDEDTNTLIQLDDETIPSNAQYNNFTVSEITNDNDFRIIFTDKTKINNLYYYRFDIATNKIINVGTFKPFRDSLHVNNGFKIVLSKNGTRIVEYITQATSDSTEIQLGNVSTTSITSNKQLYKARYGRECRAIQFLNNDKFINVSFRVLNSSTQIENYQYVLTDAYNYSAQYNTRYNYTNLAFNNNFTYCCTDEGIYTVKYENNMYKPDTKVVDIDSSAYTFKGFVSSDYIVFNETLYKIASPLQQIQVYNHAIDTGVIDTAYTGINLTNSVYYYTIVLDIDNQSVNIIESLDTKDGVCWNLSNVGTTEDKVLSGYKYGNYDGIKTGTMPNNGELNYEVSTSEQTIPAGYTSGGTIEAARQTNEDYDGCLELAQQILYGGIITNYPLDNAAHYWIFEYNGNIYCAKHTKDVPSIGYENGVQENLVWYTMSFEILTLYKFINGAYTTSYETSDTDIVMRSSGNERVFDDGVNIKSLYSDIDLLYDGYWTQQLGTNYYFKANPVN